MGVRWSGLYFKTITVILFFVLVYVNLGVTLARLDREGDLSWVPKFQSVDKRNFPRLREAIVLLYVET